MAIQLPTIQEDAAGPQISQAPEINAPALNTSSSMNADIAGAEGVGKAVVQYQQEQAYHESDTTATNATNQYLTWKQKRLYGDPDSDDPTAKTGLYMQDGDPKTNFAQFDKENQEKLKELSTAPDGQDWSGMTQNIVNRRLNHYGQQVRDESLSQYGYA